MALLIPRSVVSAAGRLGRLALLAGVALLGPSSPGAAPPPGEYEVKAVFLYNFAQFVEWPPEAFASDRSPLVIGVLGQDPFGPLLEDAVRGGPINHRPVEVKRYRRVEEIDACHVLFISRSETASLARIINRLGRRSILTVSDAEGFNRAGGMIRLLTEKNHVRFRIAPTPARAAGLAISSKLLRPAEVVTEAGDPP